MSDRSIFYTKQILMLYGETWIKLINVVADPRKLRLETSDTSLTIAYRDAPGLVATLQPANQEGLQQYKLEFHPDVFSNLIALRWMGENLSPRYITEEN